MKTKAHKFLSILKMELEEIQEDLNTLLEIYRCYEQKHEITNYVLQENSSLIQAEIAALRSLFKFLDTFSTEEYESLEALSAGVLAKFKELIKKKEYPQALYYLIERRVQKVVRYLSLE
ncbi:MAG: hypothetical protein N2442_11185 [Spirochaetes bacterium]|nr:hypothetical protein [Spirochaetota bacterium]